MAEAIRSAKDNRADSLKSEACEEIILNVYRRSKRSDDYEGAD